MKGKHISRNTQKKTLKSTRNYDKASIPILSSWAKEGDETARLQMLKLCRLERS